MELLKLRSLDIPHMTDWLQQDIWQMTHPEIQNESNFCVKKIKLNDPIMFSIVCDGTQDVSKLEQESVCVCWVDENFKPQESFLGSYQASSTGAAIS
ncbi:hypothetical protein PR048_012789 [Dryococelus australis]|uniref:Uncharacterized protein n=1 Tax=Dryococelus australis TaxID=614101 RepID=A0ABQ9HQB5_9NEOP|nr:hypothetical protein PR048_012789 [Dryococelus australis]